MSDYGKWLKQKAKEQAESAATDPNDGDIRREDAYEQRHVQRYRDKDGTKRERTPIWRFTSGTWAQLLIGGVIWLAMMIALRSYGPKDQALQAWMSLFLILPAGVLTVVTWRGIGPTWRERARWVVRLSPLLLLALGLYNAKIRGKTAATAPAPKVVAKPPAPQVMPSPGVVGMARFDEINRACRSDARRLRRTPGEAGRLEEALACARAPLPANLEGLAAKVVLGPKANPEVISAVGFLPPTPERIDFVLDRLDHQDNAADEAALDALVRLGKLDPTLTRASFHAQKSAPTPQGRMLRAVASVRLGFDADAGCQTLAVVATSTTFDLARAATDHLDRLGPRCRTIEPFLFNRLGAFRKDPKKQLSALAALRLLGFLGIETYAPLMHVARMIPPDDTLLANAARDALGEIVERDHQAQVGLSAFVAQHPSSRSLVEGMVIETAPCTAERLKVDKKEMARWPYRPTCVVRVANRPRVLDPIE